ncbi:MAG: hypothetical protein R6U43_01515 [Candidatus Krumholzibacteriales bacterium]
MDKEIKSLGMIIEKDYLRGLFYNFCRETMNLSPEVTHDAGLFDVRFRNGRGLDIKVSVYRELFIVSPGGGVVDIRVTGREGLIKAVDISLSHFLESASWGNRP